MSSPTYQIDKLNGNNYLDWCQNIKYLLMDKGLWEIIDKKQTVDKISDTAEVEKFKARAGRAVAIIYLNIQQEYRKIIEGCADSDPCEVWDRIRKNFYPDSRALHMQLHSELSTCRKLPSESINLFASRLLRLHNQITEINSGYSEIYTNFQLLRYLPNCFDSIVQGILRWPDADFKFDKIVTELVGEEKRLQLRDLDKSKNIPTTSANFSRKNKKFFNNRQTPVCWECGRKGHVRSKCRNLKDGQTPRNDISKVDFSNKNVKGKNAVKGSSRSKDSNFVASNVDLNKSSFECYPLCDMSNNFCPTGNNVTDSYSKDSAGGDGWIFDTGASHHFCSNRSFFMNYESVTGESMTVAVEKLSFPILGTGDVKLLIGRNFILLRNVLHAPGLRRNLISGAKIDVRGATFRGGNGEIKVFNKGNFLFKACLISGIYYVFPKIVSCQTDGSPVESLVSRKVNGDLWHRRFAHVGKTLLLNTYRNQSVKGFVNFKGDFTCEPCSLGKFKSVSHRPLSEIRSSQPLDLIYSDVWGPAPVVGRNGERYFITIIDDYSRNVHLYPVTFKSDVYDVVTQHIIRAENQLGRKVKAFRSDNGGEYRNLGLEDFFNSKGINHELTNTFTPQQNGTCERYNLTVMNGVRTLLNESGLDSSFWPDAALHFTYTWNRVCSQDKSATPRELYSGVKPSVRQLKPFGSVVYLGVPRQRRTKLEPKGKRGILIGYSFCTRGYRVWLPESGKVEESINVVFNEALNYRDIAQGFVQGPSENNSDLSLFFPEDENSVDEEGNRPTSPGNSPEIHEDGGADTDILGGTDGSGLRKVQWFRIVKPRIKGDRRDVYYYELGKSKQLKSLKVIEEYCKENKLIFDPTKFDFSPKNDTHGVVPGSPVPSVSDDESGASSDSGPELLLISHQGIVIPNTFQQAVKSSESKSWHESMQKEIDIIKERGVWTLAELPHNAKPVGCRWVYTLKRDEKGNIAKFKSRLVAQGFKQVRGETYDETFSPVVNFSLIRFFFSLLVTYLKWTHVQCDVASAYLYAPLDEEIYMTQPPGFTEKGKEKLFCRLRRALYGLHQSGRMWFFEIHGVLLELGFVKLNSCNCIYVYGRDVVLLLYVDDIVVIGRTLAIVNKIIELLGKHFELKVLGKTKRLLGVEFEETNGYVELHQETYIDEVFEKFKEFHVPFSSLPIVKGAVFSKTQCPNSDNERAEMARIPYRNLLGCLSFISSRTRPDISYAVNIFSQFQADPGMAHWCGLLRLLGYIHLTRKFRLKLICNKAEISAYTDADFASNRDDRTSLGGQLVLLNGASIDWRTFKQKCICLSTMEAEFVAMADCSKSLVWFDRILEECYKLNIIGGVKCKSTLFVDSQSAIDFVKSPIENHRSRHIDVKLFYIRDQVYQEIFKVVYVPSKKNWSDVFTKPFTKVELYRWLELFLRICK